MVRTNVIISNDHPTVDLKIQTNLIHTNRTIGHGHIQQGRFAQGRSRRRCTGLAFRYSSAQCLYGHVLGYIRAHIRVIGSSRVCSGRQQTPRFRPSSQPSGNFNILKLTLDKTALRIEVLLVMIYIRFNFRPMTAECRTCPRHARRLPCGETESVVGPNRG